MVLHRIRAALTVAILPLKQGVLCPHRDVKRILLIKTSSLGDVVHNLPVVSDIRHQFPEAVIDWAVEEAYAPLLALHPDVHQVIPVAVRRWRRQVWCASTWREIAGFRQRVTAQTYDAVIDTQGLLKSALLGCMASGIRHGFDSASAREPLASLCYQQRHALTRTAHAVSRNRLLVGAALGYVPAQTVTYGLQATPGAAVTDPAAATAAAGHYVVLLHASSRDDKLWPENNWVELAAALSARQPGLRMLLPFGNALEQQRSLRLAAQMQWVPGVLASVPAAMALDGNQGGSADGMDFVRSLMAQAPAHMTPGAVLLLEIGNEREHFEAAFPQLEPVWLATSAGEDQVLLLTREALQPLAAEN